MNKRVLLAITGAVSLVWVGATIPAVTADAGSKVRYVGDSSAQAVCKSIVRDNVKALDRALRQKSSFYEARNIHRTYTCNDMALNDFAFGENAVEVGEYLAPMYRKGMVTIEQVSSIGE